jgi:cytochrome c
MNMEKIQLALGCLFAAGIALSTVHPFGNPHSGIEPDAPLLYGSDAPESVRTVLEAKCGDCHSEKTRYPVYSHLAPVSWMIERDVREARSSLDMSRWQFYNIENRINALSRVASVVRSEQMPPRTYVLLHPHARLSPEEQQLIYDWAKSERKHLRWALTPGADQASVDSRTQKP